MKKLKYSKVIKIMVLIISVAALPLLKSSSARIKHTIVKPQSTQHHLSDTTQYYLGDTDNGAIGAYAVYGTKACCTAGTHIVSVMQYSTGTYFTATGLTSRNSSGQFVANLTASNGYTWDGVLAE